MANGFNSTTKRLHRPGETSKLGSRRIFAPVFKLQVLDSYRNDSDCKGNQRATARKYGIHRRQIQKWLQVEDVLRGVAKAKRPASPIQPLDCTTSTGKRSPPPITHVESCTPVDLSVRRPLMSPSHPAAWDLSWKPTPNYDISNYYIKPNYEIKHGYEVESSPMIKHGYEIEIPQPQPPQQVAAPVSKPFRLFRPFLDDDNFEEVELPCPAPIQPCESALYPITDLPSPCGSAFEQVVPRLSPLSPYSYECDMSPLCCGPRPRQTYTVDFKLQTIRSYYQDNECRGNQRAVASKFGIHRRQVQKWLQQEDDLKRKIDDLVSSPIL